MRKFYFYIEGEMRNENGKVRRQYFIKSNIFNLSFTMPENSGYMDAVAEHERLETLFKEYKATALK